MTRTPVPFDLIERYIVGDSSEADKARLESWVAEAPENRRLLGEMAAEWGKPGTATKYDSDKGWERMHREINGVNAVSARKSSKPVGRYAGIAALAAIVVATMTLIPGRSESPHVKTYTTSPGQRANVSLSDGSRVTLAPSTTLGVSGRSVELRGEALFTVTQHTGEPFIVSANGTATRVLGTTFGVRAYGNDVRVAVAEGKVVVKDEVLSTGDVALVAPGSRPAITRGANVSQLLAWAQGKLTFHLTPLREMIPDLERWYGISISVSDETLLDRNLTITLTDETPGEAGRLIGLALGVEARFQGKSLIITR